MWEDVVRVAAERHAPIKTCNDFVQKWNKRFHNTTNGGTHTDPNGREFNINELKALRWIASAAASKHTEGVGKTLHVSGQKMDLEWLANECTVELLVNELVMNPDFHSYMQSDPASAHLVLKFEYFRSFLTDHM